MQAKSATTEALYSSYVYPHVPIMTTSASSGMDGGSDAIALRIQNGLVGSVPGTEPCRDSARQIVIVGCSGHARVIVDAIEAAGEFRIAGFLDTYKSPGIEMLGYEVIGTEEDLAPLLNAGLCDCAVVAIGDNWTRAEVVRRLLLAAPAIDFCTVIHPSAIVARGVRVGRGSVILAGAVVNTGARIGEFCILNTCCSLDHDSAMMEFSSLGPRAVTGGGVRVGAYSAIGIGAVMSHDLRVGDCTVIGAGAVVVRDVPSSVVSYGVPARVVRARDPWDSYLKYSRKEQDLNMQREGRRPISSSPDILLLPCTSENWDTYLANTPHDFFHTRACHQLHANHGYSTAWLAICEHGGHRVVWPYLMRCIDGAGELYDITSAYGYSGPLVCDSAASGDFERRAWYTLLTVWREQRVVSVFTRFNPLLANHEWLERVRDADPVGTVCGGPAAMGWTVVIDLSKDQTDIWKEYNRHLRQNLRRAEECGLQSEWDPTWKYLDSFVKLYYATMKRNNASRFYLFSSQHFRALKTLAGGHASLMVTKLGSEVVAATLLIEYDRIVNVYLLGSDDSYAKLFPSAQLIHDVQVWAQRRGNRYVHLGGGRGRSEDDALLRYKKKFSREMRPFFTGRWIVDEREYLGLSEARRQRAAVLDRTIDETFFPLYRAPLRAPVQVAEQKEGL